MGFEKYQHIEKYGSTEVLGIEDGTCYIFPKIDGTNGSVWCDTYVIKAGSRNRQISLEEDNAGFYKWLTEQENIKEFFRVYPNFRLFGEWLVPHSLKTYRDDAWRKFYVFDIMDGDEYIDYAEYKPILEQYNIDYIPPLAIIERGSEEQFIKALEKNVFLVKDGEGVGEGIVIKRYGFKNRFGRTKWAKIVTSEFKEKHTKVMGPAVIAGEKKDEDRFIDDFCTEAFILKEHAKIAIDGWSSKMIGKLLGVTFYELVKENMHEALSKLKNPTIDFGKLNRLCTEKIKKTLPELF
jgi:hypothetical protein